MCSNFWELVAAKRFDEENDTWELNGIRGDRDKLYRITVIQNNYAKNRSNIRLVINGIEDKSQYEAIEGYISADLTFSERKIFDGSENISPFLGNILRAGATKLESSNIFSLFNPNWRLLRGKEVPYMNFGKPTPGMNVLFGQGLLSAEGGESISMVRICAEDHPKGHLMTVGRYTYAGSDHINSLKFYSNERGGIGKGSVIAIERVNLDIELGNQWVKEGFTDI